MPPMPPDNQTAGITFADCVVINIRRTYEVHEQGKSMLVMDEAEFAEWSSEREAKMRRLAAMDDQNRTADRMPLPIQNHD